MMTPVVLAQVCLIVAYAVVDVERQVALHALVSCSTYFWPRRICEVRLLALDESSVDAFCCGRQLLDAVRGDR